MNTFVVPKNRSCTKKGATKTTNCFCLSIIDIFALFSEKPKVLKMKLANLKPNLTQNH